MTLNEAIEILSESAYGGATCFDPRFRDAEKLGIEALIAYSKAKANGWYPPGYKLPGETEE